MSTSQSLRKGRKIRRRFSMSGHGWSSTSPKSLPSPTREGHPRGTSMSPSRRSPERVFQRLRYDSGSQTAVELTERRGRSTSPVRIFTQRQPPTTYASLPPTPILAVHPGPPSAAQSPTASEFQHQHRSPERDAGPQASVNHADLVPFSLWDYLREELLATDFDSHQELKWERVSNFLSMPLAMEKVRFCRICRPYINQMSPRSLALGKYYASTHSCTPSPFSRSASYSHCSRSFPIYCDHLRLLFRPPRKLIFSALCCSCFPCSS